jgi:hypothetical protein
MSEACIGGSATPRESGRAAIAGAADWLCLAAAPAFAIMALLTAVLDGGQMAMMCGAAQEGSPLGGMVPMYLLMSAVHAGPWLRLIAGRRAGAQAKLRARKGSAGRLAAVDVEDMAGDE